MSTLQELAAADAALAAPAAPVQPPLSPPAPRPVPAAAAAVEADANSLKLSRETLAKMVLPQVQAMLGVKGNMTIRRTGDGVLFSWSDE